MSTKINRRQFISQASCAAVGTTSIFSTLFSLRLTAGAASGGPISGYKAAVCLFLGGGNDSFNMLIPVGQKGVDESPYNDYASVRTSLALPLNDPDPAKNVHSILTTGQSFPEFGVHPKLPYLKTLYDAGNAAFVANVGTLIAPMTLAQYDAKINRPTGLFSHSDQQVHWQTIVPQVRGAGPKGWAGRVADCMHQANLSGQIAMNLSLSGNNVLQTGQSTVPYITSPSGVVVLHDAARSSYDPLFHAGVDDILSETYKNLYQKTLAERNRSSIDTAVAFDAAVSGLTTTEDFTMPDPTPENPDNRTSTQIGSRLQTIAKVIQARTTLGMDRQIFFVERGGWDHHNAVLAPQDDLFSEVNAGVEAFWKEMGHLGLQNDVLLFTASDFGRTLTSNGAGSDHAWGGNHFVIGGQINGGRIYGQYPVLTEGGPLDIGRGRLLPTTSVDEYVAGISNWFGVPNTELETVFPNCVNFFDPISAPNPLGIIS